MIVSEMILAPITVTVGGMGIVFAGFAGQTRRPPISAGLALGVGIWAACHAVGMLAFGGAHPGLATVCEFGVVLAGAGLLARFARRGPRIERPADGYLAPGVRLLFCVLAAMIVAEAGAFFINTLSHPDGDWDAWALWNLRARFLFRAGHDLATVFSPALPHTDYPPLLPVIICAIWRALGRECAAIPPLVAGAFAGLVLGGLVAAVSWLRNARIALLAGIALMGTPYFLAESAKQMADVPASLFLLTASFFLTVGIASPVAAGPVFALAGVAASLGAGIKNEGIVYVLSIGAAIAIFTCRRPGQPRHAPAFRGIRNLVWYALGALPAMLLVGAFKHSLGSTNDLLAGTTPAAALHRIIEWGRYAQIGSAVASLPIHLDRWNCLLAAMILIWLAALWRRRIGREAGAIACAAGLTFIAYCLVYLVQPHDLAWILSTSLDRLLLQMWPTLILATALLAA